MITEQVADGVHRVADGLVNWYIVEDEQPGPRGPNAVTGGRLTLIDSGWPGSWKKVGQAVGELGRSMADVAAVVLTHGHPDHMGTAERARTAGVPVHAHAHEVPRLHGKAKGASPFSMIPGFLPYLWCPTAIGFLLHAARHGFMTPKWVGAVEPFADGDELDVPGSPRAVLAPGHTAGHTCFHLAGRNVLFSGDALATLDVLTRETGPRVLPAPLNDDPRRAAASLSILEGVDAEVVLPGHGAPWRGGAAAAVARARAALSA